MISCVWSSRSMVLVHDRQLINIIYSYYTQSAFVLKQPSLSGNGRERLNWGSLSPEEKITMQSLTPSDHGDKRPTAIIWEKDQRLLWLQIEKDIQIRSGGSGSGICSRRTRRGWRPVWAHSLAAEWRCIGKGLPPMSLAPSVGQSNAETHLTLRLAPFNRLRSLSISIPRVVRIIIIIVI